MKAYIVSKEADGSVEEKVEQVKSYSVGDLLYVVREFENQPSKYDKEVMKEVSNKLMDNNIFCM